MAMVRITTQGVWSCPCGNMFGRSHWPMSEQAQTNFKEHGTCSECHGELRLTGTHYCCVEKPVT